MIYGPKYAICLLRPPKSYIGDTTSKYVVLDNLDVSHQRTASLDAVYDVRPRTQHIASRHARPGRGDDRAARDADAPRSRRKPLMWLWTISRHERALRDAARARRIYPSQHLPPSRAHRDRLRRRSRARHAENSRGAVKKEA